MLYRVTTHYESYKTGKPCKRTEYLQQKYAVANRIADANNVAAYRLSRSQDVDYFVLADVMTDEGWTPIDLIETYLDKFFTCDLTYETQDSWDARHE